MDLGGIIDEIPILTALFLGLLTAVSPCTLAANISGAAYISRNMTKPKYALLVGMLLSAGRIITFVVIGGVMIAAGHTIGEVALFSQTAGSIMLGCVLMLIGVLFLDVFSVNVDLGGGWITHLMTKTHTMGLLGAFILGMLLGLAFCPYSAALFFGMLIPLSIKVSEGYSLPLFFGIGVNVPVLVFTGMLYFGMGKAKRVMQRVSRSWTVISSILGAVLISVGVSYIAPYLVEGAYSTWLPYVVGAFILILVLSKRMRT